MDFLSDLHLSESTPETWRALQRYLASSPAQALFILGDLVDVWVGDDQIARPFDRLLWAALSTQAEQRFLGFMVGNRDFLVTSAFLAERGIQALDDPCQLVVGDQTVLLSHGDAWCAADLDYQVFRTQVRSAAWQGNFLSQPFDHRWAMAQAIRAQSRARKTSPNDPSLWADVDIPTAQAHMQATGASLLVHGHTHRPGRQVWGPWAREVLSDWDLEPDSPRPRAEILRWQDGYWRRVQLLGGD